MTDPSDERNLVIAAYLQAEDDGVDPAVVLAGCGVCEASIAEFLVTHTALKHLLSRKSAVAGPTAHNYELD